MIIHEYGHSIQDTQDPASAADQLSARPGRLGEGFGDYNSAMMTLRSPGSTLPRRVTRPNGLSLHLRLGRRRRLGRPAGGSVRTRARTAATESRRCLWRCRLAAPATSGVPAIRASTSTASARSGPMACSTSARRHRPADRRRPPRLAVRLRRQRDLRSGRRRASSTPTRRSTAAPTSPRSAPRCAISAASRALPGVDAEPQLRKQHVRAPKAPASYSGNTARPPHLLLSDLRFETADLQRQTRRRQGGGTPAGRLAQIGQ